MADQEHIAGVHTHVDENGNVITHCHGGEAHTHEHEHGHGHEHSHGHSHGHGHTHTQTKAVINRLARAIGHLESVKRMAKIILKDHIDHCLTDAVESGDQQAIDELNLAIEKFMT